MKTNKDDWAKLANTLTERIRFISTALESSSGSHIPSLLRVAEVYET
jgi:hypothetical protein